MADLLLNYDNRVSVARVCITRLAGKSSQVKTVTRPTLLVLSQVHTLYVNVYSGDIKIQTSFKNNSTSPPVAEMLVLRLWRNSAALGL
jgi:uncharacterized membrane protein